MVEFLHTFYTTSGFGQIAIGNVVMMVVGCLFIYLAITKEYEPLLLVPIGFGMLVGNIPFMEGMGIGYREDLSVLNILYHGVRYGWFPPLVFLGIGRP